MKIETKTPQVPRTSNWRSQAAARARNRKWLGYSSQVARRIHAALEENNELNQTRLAQRLEVTPQYISKVLKGKENLTLETIGKLSEVLGVELISFPDYRYNTLAQPVYVPGRAVDYRSGGFVVTQGGMYNFQPQFGLPAELTAGNTQYAMGA